MNFEAGHFISSLFMLLLKQCQVMSVMCSSGVQYLARHLLVAPFTIHLQKRGSCFSMSGSDFPRK